jgi:hypothetical protein
VMRKLFEIMKYILAILLTGQARVLPIPATYINGICYGVNTLNLPGFNPNDPPLSGYVLVFDSEFNNFNDFDMTCNAQPTSGGCADPQGKNWYVNGWTFPNNVNKLTDYTITNGVLAIAQDQHAGNWALSAKRPRQWRQPPCPPGS